MLLMAAAAAAMAAAVVGDAPRMSLAEVAATDVAATAAEVAATAAVAVAASASEWAAVACGGAAAEVAAEDIGAGLTASGTGALTATATSGQPAFACFFGCAMTTSWRFLRSKPQRPSPKQRQSNAGKRMEKPRGD